MISFKGIALGLYKVGTWLAKMILLNILWLLFTILGLGIFGVSPATSALVYVMYKWFEGETDIPVFKTFFSFYKKNFIQTNGIGLILIVVGIFLFIDIRISQVFIGLSLLHYAILLISVFVIIVSLYIFTIFGRYDLKFLQYFRQAILISFSRPLESIAMIIGLILIYILFVNIPGLLVYVGVSLPFLPLVWFSYQACLKIEEKKRELS